MSEYDFALELARFHLKEPDMLLFVGFFRDDNPDHRTVHVYADDVELPVAFSIRENADVRRRYLHYYMNVGQEITGKVRLGNEIHTIRRLRIISRLADEEEEVYAFTGKQLLKLRDKLDGNLEMGRVEDGQVILTGWAAAREAVQISARAHGKDVPCTIARRYRRDVAEYYGELAENYTAGYEVSIPDQGYHNLTLRLQADGRQDVIRVSVDRIRTGKMRETPLILVKKALGYYRRNGLKRTLRKVGWKLRGQKGTVTYEDFLKKYGVKPAELERQRKVRFSYSPKFSVVVPLYKTDRKYLTELLESIRAQTYENWELCLADGSGKEDSLQEFIRPWQERDARIRYLLLEENLGIAGNTNEALKLAGGDYIALADHDDLLTPDALYECARAINEDRNIDVLYSDEDKVDMSGRKFFEPHFKSDFNLDLLCSMNYICHLFVFSRDLLGTTGGFRKDFDGAQDHDFIFRCVECAKCIRHIPRVLYHWRTHRLSTSGNPESKLYAFENGCRAVQAHYERLGIPATVEQGPFYGMYRTRYHWEEQPLISIIIPNKDHSADLRKCIDSIDIRSVYRNYEWIIVENNSTEEETFAYYEELEKRDRVTVLRYEGPFNFSRINNYGAACAKGEYLLLLNNDTEMIAGDALKEMLDVCMRSDVGIVGARLFFADDTIQHAGVIIGFGGIAGHAFIGQDREDNGYFSRILCVQDLSAVTAACMMVRKSVFEQVGGLTEELRVAFNDIDFCLKVRETGKLVVYQPYATFYHYESKSRGQEDTAEKVDRFQSEVHWFGERWSRVLEHGDPYYNPNLSLDRADFALKE